MFPVSTVYCRTYVLNNQPTVGPPALVTGKGTINVKHQLIVIVPPTKKILLLPRHPQETQQLHQLPFTILFKFLHPGAQKLKHHLAFDL